MRTRTRRGRMTLVGRFPPLHVVRTVTELARAEAQAGARSSANWLLEPKTGLFVESGLNVTANNEKAIEPFR